MLSVSFCAAGVHDSYWTHACDVDLMNQILREKFVELYETPILENVILLILSIGHKLIRFSMYPSHYCLFLHIQKNTCTVTMKMFVSRCALSIVSFEHIPTCGHIFWNPVMSSSVTSKEWLIGTRSFLEPIII